MGILDGLLGGLASAAGSWMNWQSQKETNASNEALMRESWARDDTAVQRRKADLEAAGINPVLAAGQSASNSGPIRLEAPEVRGNPVLDAMQSMAIQQNIAQTKEQTKLTAANARSAAADADVKEYVLDQRKETELTNLISSMFQKAGESASAQAAGNTAERMAELAYQIKEAEKEGVDLANVRARLQNQLSQKDLDWFDANMRSLGISRYIGGAADIVSTAAKVRSGKPSARGGQRTIFPIKEK